MKRAVLWVLVCAVGIAGRAAVAQESSLVEPRPGMAPAERVKSVTPAAKVGDEVIGLEEVEADLTSQLAQLEQQRYALLSQRLEQLIAERLLAGEAKKRGVTVEQLLKAEIYASAPEVTDAEVTTFMTENRARLPRGDEAELRLKVWHYLRSQKVNQQREAYVRSLRTQTEVTVYLEKPAGARIQVSPDKGFVRGPKDAAVTIVEFSDFQCPFCKAVLPTVKQVMDTYPGKVKWVFRDFPIPSLHPMAPKAHEAARCAAAQGKFWEYHDLLFERSPRQSPEELKQYGLELQLDGSEFAACLDGGKYAAEVDSDLQEGIRLGVSGTPTFFINGLRLVGAQPLATFQKLIETELAKKTAQ